MGVYQPWDVKQIAIYRVLRAYKNSLEDNLGVGKGRHRPTVFWFPARVVFDENGDRVYAHVPKPGELFYDEDGTHLDLRPWHPYLYLSEDEVLHKGPEIIIEEVYERHVDRIHSLLERFASNKVRTPKEIVTWNRVAEVIYERRHQGFPFITKTLRKQLAQEAYLRLKGQTNPRILKWRQSQVAKLRAQLAQSERDANPSVRFDSRGFVATPRLRLILSLKEAEERLVAEPEVAKLAEDLAKEMMLRAEN